MANSPIYDVFFVGHAYQNDKGETKANWIEAGTGFPTNDGEGITIAWDTILPEVATVVSVNGNPEDNQTRMLPVRVVVKRRQPKQAAADTFSSLTSKKKAPAKKAPAKKEESSNAIPF